MDSSVIYPANGSGEGNAQYWLNLYGVFDIVRIDAYYFLTKEDWLRNKTQHEKDHTPPWWGKTGSLEPQVTRAEATIPCYDTGCRPGCDNPPVVIDGEKVFLFNPSDAEWEAR